MDIPRNAGDGDVPPKKEIEQDLLQLITGPALLKLLNRVTQGAALYVDISSRAARKTKFKDLHGLS